MKVYEEKPHTLGDLEQEQIDEAQNVANDLEGQRIFGKEHYEFWLISIIALAWSLFQLYLVVEPINSTISRSIHLSFAILLAFLLESFEILQYELLRHYLLKCLCDYFLKVFYLPLPLFDVHHSDQTE